MSGSTSRSAAISVCDSKRSTARTFRSGDRSGRAVGVVRRRALARFPLRFHRVGDDGACGNRLLEGLAVVVFEGDDVNGRLVAALLPVLEHHFGRLGLAVATVDGDDVAGRHVVDTVARDIRHPADGSRCPTTSEALPGTPPGRASVEGDLFSCYSCCYSCCYSVVGLLAEVGVAVAVVEAPARHR